ncbi:MAG: N-acetylmuramoyl-L-alanine amidase [Planctomycetota bacterium]
MASRNIIHVAAFVLGTVGLANPGGGQEGADQADSEHQAPVYHGRAMAVGDPDAAEAIQHVLAQAAWVATEDGQPLIPAGTTVDRVEWDAHVVLIDLTLPDGWAGWRLSLGEMEALAQALGYPFMGDPAFGGTVVRVRVGPDQRYGALEDFVVPSWPSPRIEAEPAEIPTPRPTTPADPTPPDTALRGPVTQALRQPTGALSGVTVFASCGHGWTAGTSTWLLQRPVVWVMNEDYANLDQLNYFVHYAFNAGATVVPFRPVGWQELEIVLDNDDPGVTFTGTWNDGSSSKYYENAVTPSGIVYKWTSSNTTETATARYTPEITVPDFYPVYAFTIAAANRTLQTYRIGHGGGISEVSADHRLVGNGWIFLGEYYLQAGGDNYVEITNASPQAGAIIADAIRWGNGMGDIVRPGPGTVSGYPREEECQRYWAHSELGNNAVGFTATEIWDSAGSDQDDNISTGARWAREMNQTDYNNERWRRVHLEFHTNAFDGSARGCVALVHSSSPTTYQTQYATFMANEIDADMLLLDSEFEHDWYDRASPTLSGSYGAISTTANGNEFDATIIELAFHDNQLDAELLRDDRVRAALARSSVQGIVRFLNSLSGNQVPLAFAPDTPRNVRVEDAGNGDVVLSWAAPLSDGARGDPATGYVIYQSGDGYGFGDPITLGGVLTATISGVPVGTTRYFRIAATNAGGESMPSEVLTVRRPDQGTATVLLVNGFDRLRRQQNPTAWVGSTIERQIWRRSNSYDYVDQHAEALASAGVGFASCANEAVIDGQVVLDDYAIVVWICGEESTEDATFTSTEQTLVTTFLNNGGALFVSGAEIAYDLDDQNHGRTFYEGTLKANFVSHDAGTYSASGTAGGIFSDIGPFDFNPAGGAPYDVETPDQISPQTGAAACLTYVGGSGGAAGVQYDTCVYRTVTFAFPFETITSASQRAAIMERVIGYLEATSGPIPFDWDEDCVLELSPDYASFAFCLKGPTSPYTPGHACLVHDANSDMRVDLADFALFQQAFAAGGP